MCWDWKHITDYFFPNGKYQEDEEFREGLYLKFVEIIKKEQIDKDFERSLIEGKLKYANEYSLRKRLKEIVNKHSSSMPDDFFVNIVSDETFINN